MIKQTTISIESFIIEVEFEFDQYYDHSSGENLLYTDYLGFFLISVSDTEKELLFIDEFKDLHIELVNKWMNNNDVVDYCF